MREWFNRQSWKDCVEETSPWVQIPLSPPKQGIKHEVFCDYVLREMERFERRRREADCSNSRCRVGVEST